jgi:hypothetical protein
MQQLSLRWVMVVVITTLTDAATTWQKVGLCTLRAAL